MRRKRCNAFVCSDETTSRGIYYGIFELDESELQARLRIEYQLGSYPTAFSNNASTYTERDIVSKAEERYNWHGE